MIIGLTGPAGSGKSTISNFIYDKYDTLIIDVDRVGHYVLTLSFIKDKLKDVFGKKIFDSNNEIIRSELGKIVFSDLEKLNTLNSIVHNEIYNQVKKMVDSSNKKIIIIDAALLEKIKLNQLCNVTILVNATKDIRIKRLIEKRNIDEQKASDIVDSQKNMFKGNYDYIINNDDNFKTVEKDIINILNFLNM